MTEAWEWRVNARLNPEGHESIRSLSFHCSPSCDFVSFVVKSDSTGAESLRK